jgi:ubiquinone biosynthesis protein UbiJ
LTYPLIQFVLSSEMETIREPPFAGITGEVLKGGSTVESAPNIAESEIHGAQEASAEQQTLEEWQSAITHRFATFIEDLTAHGKLAVEQGKWRHLEKMLDSLKPQNDLIQKVKRMEKSTALPRT